MGKLHPLMAYLDDAELTFLVDAKERFNVSKNEVVRRGVRCMMRKASDGKIDDAPEAIGEPPRKKTRERDRVRRWAERFSRELGPAIRAEVKSLAEAIASPAEALRDVLSRKGLCLDCLMMEAGHHRWGGDLSGARCEAHKDENRKG